MKPFVLAAAAVGLFPCTLAAQASAPELRALADSFQNVSSGVGGRVWPDLSDAARVASARRVDLVAAGLRALDPAEYTSDDRLLYENLKEVAESSVASRVCRFHLWSGTSQFSGWHVVASNFARVAPVSTENERSRTLETLSGARAAMAAERQLLQRGLDSGYTAAAPVIRAVIRQYDDLLPDDIAQSPLWAPAQRDSSPAFRARLRALLVDSIYPAAREQRQFLVDVYTPRARAEGSLRGQPDGVSCYAASLRAQTSVGEDLDQLMRAARNDLDRITIELAPLVGELTGETNVSRGVVLLRSDPRFTFASRDSILAAYRAMTKLAESRISRVVAGFPAETLAVVPYPAFQERAGLPPQYLQAALDGSRPAQVLVNLSRTERMAVANAAAHEGYPGHHLQRIAQRRASLVHPVMRSLYFGGFGEGWGIYSEQLGEEMGLYTTLLDRAGYLVHLLDVAVAAYLDVGFHTRGWTREDLVDTMMTLGGRPRANAEAYADRHAATPGQMATYFVGFRVIRALRSEAQSTLGGSFDVPQFHREVLRDGSITLASLRSKIERWIGEQRHPSQQ